MIERVTVSRGAYHDSVTLMLASRDASRLEGVEAASIVSATPLNLELLAREGFEIDASPPPQPTDLVVAIRARSEAAIAAAAAAVDDRLAAQRPSPPPRGGERPPRSLAAAARRHPAANLAVISVPGYAAAHECGLAIAAGLHVFCFSSGFPATVEASLKRQAAARGLLLMGPDCGTAVIDGVGLGFANQVERGPAGLIGASGTGLQQVTCLLDAAGIGISHAIGVGGRDLSGAVRGTMTMRAIELLGRDPGTEAIAVIAKSPHPGVAQRVATQLAQTGKPAVVCFPATAAPVPDGVAAAATLEETAAALAARLGAELRLGDPRPPRAAPGAIRGLFTGGTLRDEALAVIAAELGGEPPLALDHPPEGPAAARHLLVDYGSERLTAGRPHPMIDPGLRNADLESAAADPAVGVILVDLVLGRGAHPDPAAELAPRIRAALARRPQPLAIVVSLCGARRDPQGLADQERALREAGAVVARSNAEAARLAAAAASGRTATVGGGRR